MESYIVPVERPLKQTTTSGAYFATQEIDGSVVLESYDQAEEDGAEQ
jgi:hypothetical protein